MIALFGVLAVWARFDRSPAGCADSAPPRAARGPPRGDRAGPSGCRRRLEHGGVTAAAARRDARRALRAADPDRPLRAAARRGGGLPPAASVVPRPGAQRGAREAWARPALAAAAAERVRSEE